MRNQAKTDTSISEKRVIGSVEGDPGGPTVIILAGMHGNEPAGVVAVSNVLDTLEEVRSHFRGKVVGLRANIKALKHGVRYVDEDMNRIWFPSIIDQIREKPQDELNSSERVEIKHLLQILDRLTKEADSPIIMVDVHTFSAEGWMFTITNRQSRHTKLLSQLYAPMVFGIEETLRGTALGYYQDRGMISIGLEGGQHENDLTPYNTRASIILLLEAAGCIEKGLGSEIREFQQHLKSHTKFLPSQTELVYQHIIEPGDNFSMRPGYKNFQTVKKGEWLANDREGKIKARCDGFILMPLYQSQGDDGFFIIREYNS
jgi:succinylglutamate desuccinylase